MQFTPAQLTNLVGSHNSGGFPGNVLKAAAEISTSEPPRVSEQQWFQVLLVDVDDSGISTTIRANGIFYSISNYHDSLHLFLLFQSSSITFCTSSLWKSDQ